MVGALWSDGSVESAECGVSVSVSVRGDGSAEAFSGAGTLYSTSALQRRQQRDGLCVL